MANNAVPSLINGKFQQPRQVQMTPQAMLAICTIQIQAEQLIAAANKLAQIQGCPPAAHQTLANKAHELVKFCEDFARDVERVVQIVDSSALKVPPT